jgi:hypothetical protein
VEGEEGILILLMDPGQYRNLEETVKAETQVRKDKKNLVAHSRFAGTVTADFISGSS